jgi:hypothetical protein
VISTTSSCAVLKLKLCNIVQKWERREGRKPADYAVDMSVGNFEGEQVQKVQIG